MFRFFFKVNFIGCDNDVPLKLYLDLYIFINAILLSL